VDFEVDVPGDYKLVDHAISRVSKGGLGILHVTGEANPDVFQDLGAATPPPTTEPAETPAGATAAASTPATEPADEAIAIDLKDNVFEPKELTVSAGANVTFTLDNLGTLPHNMHIANAGGSFDGGDVSAPELILAGQKGTLTWSAPGTPGTYAFRCDVHPVEMTGTITVQ
jgi:plastocyanin